MRLRLSITAQIVITLVFLQLVVIGLFSTQHSNEMLQHYYENEHEKAAQFLQLIEPVVTLQLTLGFEDALVEQLNAIAPGSKQMMQLQITDMKSKVIYDYRHADYSDEEMLELESIINDPYLNEPIARVRLLHSTQKIDHIKASDNVFQLKIIAIIAVVALLHVLIVQKILSPLRRLSENIRLYNPENGECSLEKSGKHDEVSQIQNRVVEMLERIREYAARLNMLNETLERRVLKRTRALEKANAKLEALSITDALTLLPNRRKFNTQLASMWAVYAREKKPLSLIVADIDHFKAVNDTYGHSIGDQVLCEIAQRLDAQPKREIDLVARYGGEEFVLLLPSASCDDALAFAKGLQESVRSGTYSDKKIALTLSFGIATVVPSQAINREILFDIADKALYEAKTGGRDRIVARQL